MKLYVITVGGEVELATTDKNYANTVLAAMERGAVDPNKPIELSILRPHPDFLRHDETWL